MSQDDLTKQVEVLKHSIESSKGSEKLAFMDSLTVLIRYRTEYRYDSIAKATIAYAYELDSLNIILGHTSDLIYYCINRSGKPEEARQIFDEFNSKELDTDNYDLLARLYSNGADSYFFSKQLEESIPIYDKAEHYAIKAGDSSLYAYTRSYKATAYSDNGDDVRSSKLLKETADFFTRRKDTVGLLYTGNSLANIYSKIGFFEEAAKERDEVIKIAREQNDIRALIPNLVNAAIDAGKQEDSAKRIAYLEEASQYVPANPQVGLVVLYQLLSAYAVAGHLEKAKVVHKKIQERHKTILPISYWESVYISAETDFLLAQEKYSEALTRAQQLEALRLEIANQEGIFNAYEKLYHSYKGLGSYKKAYEYYHKYATYKDSINSVQKARALAYYQTLYETEKRDFKIASQQSDIEILDQKNHAKQQLIVFGGLGLVLLFTIIYLWRSQYFAKRKQKMQMKFSQDLIKGQEEERYRIARELHDGIGQKLVLLKKKSHTTGPVNMQNLMGNTLDELRDILEGLRPGVLERLGITKALEALIHQVDEHSDLFFTAEIDNIDDILNKQNALHLYRIIQELLNNIIKHSKAKSATVTIEKKRNIIKATVTDNGKGFTVIEKLRKGTSLGMKTLMERAKIMGAKIDINSAPNKGTLIELTIPKL